MARILGANAVGMSTVPEVILARFFGLRVAACSVITNFAAGMTGAELSHQETKDMAPVGGAQAGKRCCGPCSAAACSTADELMLPQEIIRRKRDGAQLTADEIAAFIAGLTSGRGHRGPGRGLRHGGLLQRHEPPTRRWR